MTENHHPGLSRPINFNLWAGIPLALMLLLLLADPTGIDFAFSSLFYSPDGGFTGKHSWFLEDLLHDRAKQAVILLGLSAIVALLLSLLPTCLRPWRTHFAYVVLALGLATAIVTPLKQLTAMHCPWDLQEFGGQEIYTSLLEKRAPTLKPGKCWPGGHASAGFSLLALFFALRDRHPRLARRALAVALTIGTLFSLGRIMQGAHFLSHNLWTLLFDWMICLTLYRLMLYRPGDRSPQPQQQCAVRPG